VQEERCSCCSLFFKGRNDNLAVLGERPSEKKAGVCGPKGGY